MKIYNVIFRFELKSQKSLYWILYLFGDECCSMLIVNNIDSALILDLLTK